MSLGRPLSLTSHVPTLSKRQLCVVRRSLPAVSLLCRLDKHSDDKRQSQPPHQQPLHQQVLRRQPAQQLAALLARPLAGCSAVAACLFTPVLPTWAAESFEYMSDNYLDPNVAESPDILNALLIVVVTYLTVMLLYLWLSSFVGEDGDASAGGSDTKQQQPRSGQSELPPGYGQFLDVHVRSYVNTNRHVRALQALEQAEPLEGEDLEQLKGRLAAGAAEALDQQIRDCERLVRTKLLARKMGYKPGTPTHKSDGSSTSNGTKQHHDTQAEIAHLLDTSVFSAPGGLNSPQHRAEIEALIDEHLDDLLPPGGGAFHEDLIVRQVLRRLVGHLVAEESLLLLEGVDHGKKALQAAEKLSKSGSRKWGALW